MQSEFMFLFLYQADMADIPACLRCAEEKKKSKEKKSREAGKRCFCECFMPDVETKQKSRVEMVDWWFICWLMIVIHRRMV